MRDPVAMSARVHALGAGVALLVLAYGVMSGCGSSGSGGAAPDAGTTYANVVTGGGGPLPASSVDPFGGSSSGSGGGEGGTEDGSVDATVGSSSGGTDATAEGSPQEDGGTEDAAEDGPVYTPPLCDGVHPCDLRSNTCCLANSATGLVGTCTPGAHTTCPNNMATVHCLQALECGGLSCCGDILELLGQVESLCIDVADGGNCPYVPWTVSQIGVQLCKTDAECKNGQPCVHQTCAYGAVLDMCGVQSGIPLDCAATQ